MSYILKVLTCSIGIIHKGTYAYDPIDQISIIGLLKFVRVAHYTRFDISFKCQRPVCGNIKKFWFSPILQTYGACVGGQRRHFLSLSPSQCRYLCSPYTAF